MYSICLCTGHSTGIYGLLNEVYGPLYANAIMDFCMYSLLSRSDAAHNMQARLRGSVIFSKERFDDNWYSNLFARHITEGMSLRLRSLWIELCKQNGTTDAWISIDGSNNDCSAVKCELAEPGKSKSHTNANVVSYMYAVNAETGMPITYSVANGGKIDSKAFMKMSAYLEAHGMKTKGVILDGGFCTPEVFQLLEDKGIPYVIMLKGDNYAHRQMYEKHAREIKWNVRNIVGEKSLFGISTEDKCQIFKGNDLKAHVSFFYDGVNGTERSSALIKRIMHEASRIRKAMMAHKDVSVNETFSKYLSLEPDEDGNTQIIYNYDRWQEDLDAKGFYSIATSEKMTSITADTLYGLRDTSETQYMYTKSQLGFDVTRTHTTESIENKFLVCFVSSIIRSHLQNACKSVGLDTNQMFMEIDRLSLILSSGDVYIAVHDESRRQKTLLAALGISTSFLDKIAEEVNTRKGPICSQYRKMPQQETNETPKRGRPKKDATSKEDDKVKRPVGRPKGSTKKKSESEEPKEKRKPGRPKGSKNKISPKRKGRPKGSKNKKTLERESMEADTVKSSGKNAKNETRSSKQKS